LVDTPPMFQILKNTLTCVVLCWNVVSQNDVGDCAQQVASLESQLSIRMQKLHTTVQSKNAVPTAQVYVSRICCTILPVRKVDSYRIQSFHMQVK